MGGEYRRKEHVLKGSEDCPRLRFRSFWKGYSCSPRDNREICFIFPSKSCLTVIGPRLAGNLLMECWWLFLSSEEGGAEFAGKLAKVLLGAFQKATNKPLMRDAVELWETSWVPAEFIQRQLPGSQVGWSWNSPSGSQFWNDYGTPELTRKLSTALSLNSSLGSHLSFYSPPMPLWLLGMSFAGTSITKERKRETNSLEPR